MQRRKSRMELFHDWNCIRASQSTNLKVRESSSETPIQSILLVTWSKIIFRKERIKEKKYIEFFIMEKTIPHYYYTRGYRKMFEPGSDSFHGPSLSPPRKKKKEKSKGWDTLH